MKPDYELNYKPVQKCIDAIRRLPVVRKLPADEGANFNELIKKIWEFMINAKLVIDEPCVIKHKSHEINVVYKQNGLAVIQDGKLILGDKELLIQEEFDQFQFLSPYEWKLKEHKTKNIRNDYEAFEPTGPEGDWSDALNYPLDAVGEDLDKHVHEKLGKIFFTQLKCRLEELESEWLRARSINISKAPQLIKDHIRKFSTKNGKSFQKKLTKFLLRKQSLLDVKPEFAMACMKLNAQELIALAKFCERNSSDINFISKDDFTQAFNMAKVESVQTG